MTRKLGAARRFLVARSRAGGYTYIWLLFVLAIGAAGAAALAQVWSTATQRDREREQIYRGEQIAHALWSFQAASGVGPARAPRTLDELVEDRRSPSATRPLRHLRRVYDDPFTGQPDWVLERDEKQGIVAVRSRSNHPSRIVQPGEREAKEDAPASASEAADGPPSDRPPGPRVSDRRFAAQAPPGAAAEAAAPASAVASAPASNVKPIATPSANAASAVGSFTPYVFRNVFGDSPSKQPERRPVAPRP